MSEKNNKQIVIWLFSVCAMIFLMIIVGGITRLTESGLSMVHWHPISGIVPPLSEADWQAEFAAYKQFPEYRKINTTMNLAEFKSIFYWEFSHRLLGRLIGAAFFLPFMFFLISGKVSKALVPKLWAMFGLGALQGLLGWWMVKSGLVDRPDVSHYRLTAHLGLAILIYMYMFWVASGQTMLFKRRTSGDFPKKPVMILMGLIFMQILLGGLVAGLNAGMVYNNWPLMGAVFVPQEILDISPWYMNFFENIATVQFDHRILAYIIVVFAVYVWLRLRRYERCSLKLAGDVMIFSIMAQVLLGIFTLIYVVPIALASLHQAGAIIALSSVIIVLRLGTSSVDLSENSK